MKADMVVYKGRINKSRNGIVPLRGQGLTQSREIKVKGGRQFLEKHNLRSEAEVKFLFPKVTEKSTQYNYMAEIIF